jgi:hypothetical protein
MALHLKMGSEDERSDASDLSLQERNIKASDKS